MKIVGMRILPHFISSAYDCLFPLFPKNADFANLGLFIVTKLILFLTMLDRLYEFEISWLGVSSPPPRIRMEKAKWEKDLVTLPDCSFCHKCGRSVVVDLYQPSDRSCPTCRKKRFPWISITRLGSYEDPLRGWIHDVKFRRDAAMGKTLGRLLGESVVSAGFHDGIDVVVPMPTTFRRRLRRSIDHAGVIASATAHAIHRPLVRALRKSARPPQRAVGGKKRQSNVKGSIRPAAFSSVAKTRVLLVDDIATTHASIIEATHALIQGGHAHSVRVGVLAVTDDHHQK